MKEFHRANAASCSAIAVDPIKSEAINASPT